MPSGLNRYYGKGHLHFITFSCYGRLPLLKAARARDIFVKELEKVRAAMGFRLLGYVVMPEHCPSQEQIIFWATRPNAKH
jgi:putative transposase